VATHDHAEGEERPVGPGDALVGLDGGLVVVLRPEVLPAVGGAAGEKRDVKRR
jgi:hypothetical protein